MDALAPAAAAAGVIAASGSNSARDAAAQASKTAAAAALSICSPHKNAAAAASSTLGLRANAPMAVASHRLAAIPAVPLLADVALFCWSSLAVVCCPSVI